MVFPVGIGLLTGMELLMPMLVLEIPRNERELLLEVNTIFDMVVLSTSWEIIVRLPVALVLDVNLLLSWVELLEAKGLLLVALLIGMVLLANMVTVL